MEARCSREELNIRQWLSLAVFTTLAFVAVWQAGLFSTRQSREVVETRDTRFWRAVIWHVPTAYVVVDCKSGAIVDWNPAAEEITQWSTEEAVGKVFTFLLPDDLVQQHKDWLSSSGYLDLKGRVKVMDCTLKQKDGSLVQAKLVVRVLQSEGQYLYLLTLDRRENILSQRLPELDKSYEDPSSPSPADVPVLDVRQHVGEKQPFNYNNRIAK